MTERHAILMIEDTPALARTYQGFLRDESYDLQHVESGEEGLEVIARNAPNALLLDLRLPGMDGMEVLRKLRSKGAEFPIIVITAHGSLTTAVEAMRDGASDFLVKPFTAERLKVTLRNLLEKQDLKQTVKSYEAALNRGSFQDFIGSSIVMQGVYRLIEGAAGSRATVFITGESGTGKEVAARAIHSLSPRCDRPFVALNCAAIPRDLMESEIFGHVKGAFTGASAQRDGAADRADGGTLFLDELCEMAPDLQTKLLRFVQTGTFRKVGGDEERQVDVRFVCATNRDPLIEVQEGRFREDLYYRLHVVPIHLPPLRERGEDILEIAEGLLTRFAEEEGKRFSGFQEDARQVLLSYLWPGNVRELENVIRNAVVLNDADCMTEAMLPRIWREHTKDLRTAEDETAVRRAEAPQLVAETSAPKMAIGELAEVIRPLAEVEKEAIERAVALCAGDVRKAAVFLGIGPATIYRKRRSWAGNAGSDPESDAGSD